MKRNAVDYSSDEKMQYNFQLQSVVQNCRNQNKAKIFIVLDQP
jgi:hypothetical protein